MKTVTASILSKEKIAQARKTREVLAEKHAASIGSRAMSALQGAGASLKNMGPFQKLLLGAGAATAIGVGSQLARYGVSSGVEKAHARKRPHQYRAMVKMDPDLGRNPRAREVFNVVHRASPYVGAEPVISAAVVRSILDSPALDERKFKSILDLERAHQDTRHPWAKEKGVDAKGIGEIVKLMDLTG